MNLFVSLAIMVVSYLLSNLAKPKSHPSEQKPALDSDITFPQADEGTKQIVVFGEAWLPNWSVLWHGNYRAYGLQDHGTTIGYMYSYSMLMGLCRGPINEIAEIKVGERTAYRPSDDGSPVLTGTQEFQVYKPKLFGGTPEGQGGINVKGWLLMGQPDQVLPPYVSKLNAQATSDSKIPLASFMPGEHPGYRGMVTILCDGYVSYNNTNPSAWSFLVRRTTAGWDGDAWYPQKATIKVSSGPVIIPNPQLSDPNIDDDTKRTFDRTVTVIRDIYAMNPVHVLIEGMTNRDWGRGLSLDEINLASYTDAANIIYDEGLGMTMKWDRSGPLSDFMQQVIDFVGAAQYPDPVTGKISLKLIRGDYSADNIRTFSYTSGIKSVSDNTATTADSSANQVIVTYTSPVTGKRGQIRAQNTALFTSLDSVLIQSRTYDLAPNADLAKRLAERDLKALSSGLRRLKLQMDRSAWNIVPGQVIKVTGLTDHKIESMVLRVGKIDKSGGTDGTITLNCMQDVFALDTTEYSYTVDTQPVWKPPVPGDTLVKPAPPLISNLHLLAPWDGHTFGVGWDRGADASYYDVQVVVPGQNNKVVRFRTHVMDNTFTYTLDDMIADGGPWRSVEVQVRAVSFTNGAGPWFKLGLYNPQIAALTGIQIVEGMKQSYFSCNRPVENDWSGILVYISATSGFVPDGSTLVYDGTDLFVTLATLADGSLLASDTEYYLRAAGYDNFGKDELNFSSEIVFGVVAMAPDANTIVSQMIKDGALEISKFARTIAPPLIVSAVPNAYAGSNLILNTGDNPPKQYRWDATQGKYVSALDAADIAGTIDPTKLPQIDTSKLIGLIPTTQLSGKVTANQISANAIGADQIAAGAIIAGKLAAGAVQAGALAANAVTAGTIAVGAVGADQIAARSISSDKLLVGDMTNQCDDPDFNLGDMRSWTTPDTANWYVDSTSGGLGYDGGKGALVGRNFGGAAARFITVYNTRMMAVSKGDIWYAAVQTFINSLDANTQMQVYIIVLDANKTFITGVAGTVLGSVGGWQNPSVQYEVTNPAVKYLQVALRVNNSGGASNAPVVIFDQVQMLRMSGVTLIQNGSISTQKIAAAAITGDKIVGNTITGDKVVANTITGDKIAVNTITANNIAAGSISADKLMVGSSPNLLTDPGWLNGGQFWNAGNVNADFGAKIIINSNEKVLQVVANQNSSAYFDSTPRPCLGGTWYMASVYGVAAATNGMYLAMYFIDGNNNVVAYSNTQYGGGNADWGTLSGYARVYLKMQAPGSAIKVVLRVGINDGSYGTGGWSYHPQIEECFANQALPGPWGAAINTVIGPGNIQTGSLSAISANLGAITAGSLNINNRFIVGSDGTAIIQTGTTGQRSVMAAGQFYAFDANNTLRMRCGVW